MKLKVAFSSTGCSPKCYRTAVGQLIGTTYIDIILQFSSRLVFEEEGSRVAGSACFSLRLINQKQKLVSVANQHKN